jgi:hypothetical protein
VDWDWRGDWRGWIGIVGYGRMVGEGGLGLLDMVGWDWRGWITDKQLLKNYFCLIIIILTCK